MSFTRKIKRGNKVYLAEVENKWINGKCIQKHIRYIGKEADGKTILSGSISNIEVDEVKVYGPLLVLHHIAEKIELSTVLGHYSNEILSMVYAHCIDYRSINQMQQWFKRTDLNTLLNIENVTEKKLLNALDYLEERDALNLQQKIFEQVKKRYKIKSTGIIYDVTNTYLYGNKCILGKKGRGKGNIKDRPLIQIALGVTRNKSIPMFHKVFDGNVHDTKTLQDLLFHLKQYKARAGLFIFDRGACSARNIREVKSIGYDVLCGIAIKGDLKNKIRLLIEQNDLIQLKNRVRLTKLIYYVTTIPYMIDGINGTLALCFNEEQRKGLRESRYDEITNAQQLISENKSIKGGLEKYFDKNGKVIHKILHEAEEFDGYSCIFTTKKLLKDDIVHLYFDKDVIEQAFKTIKGITHLQPVRHWLYNRVVSHVFICYLSFLLLSLLKVHLKKIALSPQEALTELSTMYKVYMKDSKKNFKIARIVTLTKKQEIILKAINPVLIKT